MERRRGYAFRFNSGEPDWSVRGLVYRLAVNAAGLWVADALIPGIEIDGWASLIAASALFALVNALLRPFAMLFSFCLIIATFGLFVVVVNAAMLGLTAWLADALGMNFELDGFWSAVFGALVISLISMVASALFGGRRRGGRFERL